MKTILIILVLLVAAYEAKQGCIPEECPSPKTWSDPKCRCECPKTKKIHADGAFFIEETCTWCIPQTCASPKVFNKLSCNCECAPHESPAIGWIWDENKCEAVCNRSCLAPQIIDIISCTCGCPNVPNLSPADLLIKQWNNNTCQVECINKQPAVASTGKTWDENVCAEVCIRNEPNPQPIDTKWNPTTCETECLSNCIPNFVRQPLNQDNPDCTCICPILKKETCISEGGEFSDQYCNCRKAVRYG